MVRPRVPPSDEELAAQARRGCPASFDQLLRRFQRPVLHFLRQRTDPAEAEDLAQETFLRVYENLHRYRRRWPFAAWLFTIARRVAINHHRRARPVPGGEAVAAALSVAADPAAAAAEEEGRRRLWATAAAVLSEEQTTALWLYYVEEMPVKQIAAVLECSRAAVKTMMFRARKKLLPWLVEEDRPRRKALRAAEAAAAGRMVEVSHD